MTFVRLRVSPNVRSRRFVVQRRLRCSTANRRYVTHSSRSHSRHSIAEENRPPEAGEEALPPPGGRPVIGGEEELLEQRLQLSLGQVGELGEDGAHLMDLAPLAPPPREHLLHGPEQQGFPHLGARWEPLHGVGVPFSVPSGRSNVATGRIPPAFPLLHRA